MTGDLRPVVTEAVRLFGSPTAPIFDLCSFGAAMQSTYELRRQPDFPYCSSVLDRLGFVRRLAGSYLWLYTPEPQLVPDRETEAAR